LVLPHIQHSSVICCTVNTIWLHPNERAGTAGIRMLKRAVGDLQGQGVTLFRVADKGGRDGAFGKILTRLGFAAEETVYSKVVP
jgi:hypothetical protein